MKKNISIVFFVFCCWFTIGQSSISYNNNWYISGSIGTNVNTPNKELQFGDLEYQLDGLKNTRGDVLYNVWRKVNLHLGVKSTGYVFGLNSNYSFNNYPEYNYEKTHLNLINNEILLGGAYKVQLKRLVFLPYFDLKFSYNTRSRAEQIRFTSKNYEKDSIRVIYATHTEVSASVINIEGGMFMYYHITRNMGLNVCFAYSNFQPTVHLSASENNLEIINQETQNNFNNFTINLGLFFSFKPSTGSKGYLHSDN